MKRLALRARSLFPLILSAVSLGCGSTVEGPIACPTGFEAHGERCLPKEIEVEGATFTMGRGFCPPVTEETWPEYLSGECELPDAPHEVTVRSFAIDAVQMVIGLVHPSSACPELHADCATDAQLTAWSNWTDQLYWWDAYHYDLRIRNLQAVCERFGKRLPTEAEWELVASQAGERLYPWGDAAPTCDRVWLDGDCGAQPPSKRVAQFPASPEGVFDLAGNVAEVVLPDGQTTAGYYPIPWLGATPGYHEHCDGTCKPAEHVGARGGDGTRADQLGASVRAYDPDPTDENNEGFPRALWVGVRCVRDLK